MTCKPDNLIVHIVDDDESVRKGLSRLMRSLGIESHAYATPESFLAAAHHEAHACVLMDITMPRMSGLELGAKLREQGVHLPVIAVSARDDDETRHRARELGVRFFLRKPVDDQALLDAISWVIDEAPAAHPPASGA